MPEAHVEVIKAERGSEGRRAGGSRGRRAVRAALAASSAPGNPGHPAQRKLFAVTDFLPALDHAQGENEHPTGAGARVRQGRLAAGLGSWSRAGVCPTSRGRKRRCSLAQLEVARDSHYFEKLHLAWEKKAVWWLWGSQQGCLCVQGGSPGRWWGWDPTGP